MFGLGTKNEYMIVGLGNPGKKYELSRHNCGFRAVDYLCEKYGIKTNRGRFSALTGAGTVAGVKVVVLKPTTFMNLSGNAVEAAAKYYKIPPERIIVIFDDVSLAPGHIRIRKDGSAGGHNGIKSVIERLGTEEFRRIKIGVGEKPNLNVDLADWVLSMPSSEDRRKIASRLDDVAAATELMVKGELTLAQSRFNG
ncbi:MAG: aminoacyl-tRNA hydrolase [Ruminococcaceae bacterium]|nr:aminoacyl-tRNA hydrolase [Oscillospiraceae bacterium]